MISFRVYNRRIIVINSASAVHDLLDKRAQIYSDRPLSWMYGVLCGRVDSVFNIAHGPRHRKYRKMLHSGLGARTLWSQGGYSAQIEDEVEILIGGLMNAPAEYEKHIRRWLGSLILLVDFANEDAILDPPRG